MRIAVASDHAGVQLKAEIIRLLRELGHTPADLGPDGPDPVDYPDFAVRVGTSVAGGEADRGILMCGTGIGMGIVANRIPGVRAAVCHDVNTARLSRAHNDANVLCLGARILETKPALEAVRAWCETEFEGGRHEARIDKIRRLDGARGGCK